MSKKFKLISIVVLCVAMVLTMGFAGCKTTTAGETAAAGETTAAAAETTAAAAETTAAAAGAGPIKLGHANFFTGPYSHIGDQLDQASIFTLSYVNQNPPIAGREIKYISIDQGTIGEGAAMRQLVDVDKVDLLMNVGMEYLTYRDWLMQYIADNGRPFLPSVHGGSIDKKYGGTVAEPIFRAAPQDSDQGPATIQVAKDKGAKTVVVMAVEIDGYQTQKNSAIKACKVLGLDLLAEINMEPEGTYRAEVAKVQQLNPDAIVIFADSTDGGIIVKNASEMGMSKIFVGPSDWMLVDFPTTATIEAIQKQKLVEFVSFTYADGPAWDFFSEAWNNNPDCIKFNDASLGLTQEFYDSITLTSLAIKKAQSTKVADLVPAYIAVAMGPGKKVYNYKEGWEALDKGEDIDYSGVTGEMNYSPTGVCSGAWGIYDWKDLKVPERIAVIDGKIILDLSTAIEGVK